MSGNENADKERAETEIIDPDAPVRFVRLTKAGVEVAVIPWDEAEAIAEAVKRYNAESDR